MDDLFRMKSRDSHRSEENMLQSQGSLLAGLPGPLSPNNKRQKARRPSWVAKPVLPMGLQVGHSLTSAVTYWHSNAYSSEQ